MPLSEATALSAESESPSEPLVESIGTLVVCSPVACIIRVAAFTSAPFSIQAFSPAVIVPLALSTETVKPADTVVVSMFGVTAT